VLFGPRAGSDVGDLRAATLDQHGGHAPPAVGEVAASISPRPFPLALSGNSPGPAIRQISQVPTPLARNLPHPLP
jgi:hypothetical protein